MTWLLIFILALSLYDWRTRRIPNWCTLPVILAGMIAHFPGSLDLWFVSFLLVSAWTGGRMGAGDVKLWMAVLWALPNPNNPSLMLPIFISFMLTGLAQMVWRSLRSQPASGVKSPAAWRVIPFLLMAWHVH